MDTSTLKGIEQGRASCAYEYVSVVATKWVESTTEKEKKHSKAARNYKAYTRKIPMLIKTNGLGAALAFIKAKGKDDSSTPYGLLYEQIGNWLQKSEITKGLMKAHPNMDLVKIVIQQDSYHYRILTIEVLALMGWMSRFAEGLIMGNAEEE